MARSPMEMFYKHAQGLGFRVHFWRFRDLGFRDLGFRIQGLGLRASGCTVGSEDFGFRDQGLVI